MITLTMKMMMMLMLMMTMTMTMVRSGGRSGASASRKPALLDRTKGGRQAEVTKVVIVIPLVSSIIILATSIILVVTSIIPNPDQAGEAVSLGGGSKTTPKPTFAIAQASESAPIFEVNATIIVFFVRFLTISLRPPAASLPWHSPVGQSSVGQKYLTWTPGQVTWMEISH